jgi:diguanylate cyclase (GGDEF)-like protein
MANNPPALFEDQLGRLRQKYVTNLPSRLAEIESAWQLVRDTDSSDATFRDLHRLVHSFVGSSGTYGFKAISHAARSLEVYLRSLLGKTERLDSDQCAQIDLLISVLNQVPAEVTGPDTPADFLTPEPASPPHTTGRKTIYLVGPDRRGAEELAEQVGHFGYVVRTFSTTDEVLAALDKDPPRVIVLDSPDAGGLPELRAHTALPIMLISGHDDLMARLAAVRAGAAAYLIKPIDLTEFAEQLDALVERQVADPYRILIVDDSTETAEFIAASLSRAGMLTNIVNDPLQVVRPLREFNPDLILMDLYMPGCNGLELAAVIRQQHEYISIPIVYLSTETDLNKQLAAMRLGGDEFLTKPIEPFHLIAAVMNRSQRSRVLRSLVVRDGLTGLLNHTATEERLGVEVARADRQNGFLAYAMIDLDHFKAINDTYGHPVGDHVLKGLARVLQQRLRKTDVIGRYGGEEFAVILPDTDGRSAVRVMDEIRMNFGKIQHSAGGTEFFVNFSCGVAAYPLCRDAVELNDAADRALYRAKELGRNRVEVADRE